MIARRNDGHCRASRIIRHPRWLTAIALLLAITCAPSARAQDVFDVALSESDRDEVFSQLAQDVAQLEHRLGIVKRVVKLVRPSVVHIEAKKNRAYRDRFGIRGDSIEEAGSGVLVAHRGKKYVLTNRHVIRYSDNGGIKVQLADGRILRPTKIWHDPTTDVAILAIRQVNSLIAAREGDSRQMDIGDFVLAVGSPFNLSQSVTYGIISAKHRHNLDLGEGEVKLQNFMQTDAAINPGNSGGPLINLRGEVVGLNTAIASSSGGNEGIGFAIPIHIAMQIARQLVDNDGVVQRAYLGVTLDRDYSAARFVSDGSTHIQGARVSDITPKSPASLVGIAKDDIILAFDGVRILDDDHLVNIVGLTEVGREVPVTLLRGDDIVNLQVSVANKKKFDSGEKG